MKEKVRKKNRILAIVFISVMLFLVFLFFLQQVICFGNPAANNYRIESLKPTDPVDGYLYTAENAISLVFMGIIFAYLLVFLLLIIFKKNSMHLVMVLVGNLLFIAFTLTRVIYCFSVGSTSIIVGIFYLASLCGAIFMLYEFLRRGLDGDALTPYMVTAIVTFGLYFFASATKSSYSVLNAYSHLATIIDKIEVVDGVSVITSHSVIDVVFWGGYATTRLYALLFALLVFINTNFAFDPEEALKEVGASIETQVN